MGRHTLPARYITSRWGPWGWPVKDLLVVEVLHVSPGSWNPAMEAPDRHRSAGLTSIASRSLPVHSRTSRGDPPATPVRRTLRTDCYATRGGSRMPPHKRSCVKSSRASSSDYHLCMETDRFHSSRSLHFNLKLQILEQFPRTTSQKAILTAISRCHLFTGTRASKI